VIVEYADHGNRDMARLAGWQRGFEDTGLKQRGVDVLRA
jgi:hypothetical protein